MPLDGTTFITQVLSGYFASMPLVLEAAGNRVVIHARLQCRPEEMPTPFLAWGLVRSLGLSKRGAAWLPPPAAVNQCSPSVAAAVHLAGMSFIPL